MQQTIYFFTQAYNAEKTLARTIESVLAQTYTNIIYYVGDNASTDKTKEIILHYANLDDRIRPIFFPENKHWEMYNVVPEILKTHNEGYYVQLDADDEYEPDFAQKLLDFMNTNNLDIAACASKYIDGTTGEDISKLLMKEDLFFDNNSFSEFFSKAFIYFRDIWGKIISLKVLKDIDYKSFDKTIATGLITCLPMEALFHADKVGVFHERLHKYYLYPDSLERNNPKRIFTPTIYWYYYEFLVRKCGEVSKENKEYLFKSYCNALSSKLKGLDMNSLTTEERVNLVSLIEESKLMNVITEYGNDDYISIIKHLVTLIKGE